MSSVYAESISVLFSLIAQVIIEKRVLWLVEDCVISRYNQLARRDYGRSAKFQMAPSHFVNVTQKMLNAIEENPTVKGIKDATKFG